jgi:hypothetical protein
MSDSLRTGDTRQAELASDPDRTAKIEALLVAGLDHYFAARYEQAVNVWTRVLFLDRGHPRARAYIDRARTALAERQRESEELLQRGIAAFHDGNASEARRLLRAAIDGGAVADDAHAFLVQLQGERERVAAALADGSTPSESALARPGRESALRASTPSRSPHQRLRVLGGAFAVVALIAAYSLALRSSDVRSMLPLQQSHASAPAAAAREAALPLPQRSELVLTRARALAAQGHLREAVAALELVRPTDPQKSEADRFRADLQHQLLGLTADPTASLTPR